MQGGHEPLLVDVGLLDGVHQLAEDVLHHGGPGEEAVPGPVQGLPDQQGQAQGGGGGGLMSVLRDARGFIALPGSE